MYYKGFYMLIVPLRSYSMISMERKKNKANKEGFRCRNIQGKKTL